jgi:methylthioribose-1-phosphate isomerase
MPNVKTICWAEKACRIVDQTQLPGRLVYEDVTTIESMYDAIKKLKVRGAPAIGIAGAFGLYLGVRDFPENGTMDGFLENARQKGEYLASSRPTAVNLSWAIARMNKKALESRSFSIPEIKSALFNEAQKILDEDILTCLKIGENGFEEIKKYRTILTHCNAGGLATGGMGTALAPIYFGKEKGVLFNMYADETRPLLQGARITAFELMAAGIHVTLICDNMSAAVMAMGKIDAVIVGADRIAANGDTANKIGTYGLALIAQAHGVPFYVAAPFSTFDLAIKTGKEIPIEFRGKDEIINAFGKPTAPADVTVFNPAFDVTPNKLITGIITERGVIKQPYEVTIKEMHSLPMGG